MNKKSLLARGVAALALAGLIGAALADGSTATSTKIKLIGKDRQIETLTFEGELPIGESRGLYTDAGTAVTVLRTDAGLSIQTPERTIEVPYGDHDAISANAGSGEPQEHRVVVIKQGGEDSDGDTVAGEPKRIKRVFVLKNGADDADAPDLHELQALGELDELGELDALDTLDADGKQVVIVRKLHRTAGADAAVD